jgi:hypothetical protein
MLWARLLEVVVAYPTNTAPFGAQPLPLNSLKLSSSQALKLSWESLLCTCTVLCSSRTGARGHGFVLTSSFRLAQGGAEWFPPAWLSRREQVLYSTVLFVLGTFTLYVVPPKANPAVRGSSKFQRPAVTGRSLQ